MELKLQFDQIFIKTNMRTYILFYVLVFAFTMETARGAYCKINRDGVCLYCAPKIGCASPRGRCGKDCKKACFPGNTVVTTETGDIIKMSDVKIGDKIATVSPSGDYTFSEVRAFMHRETDIMASYLRLETSSGKNIVLSHTHVIFMAKSNKSVDMENKFAEEVEIGDFIFHIDQSNGIIPEMVISKSLETLEGAYVPLTTEGTLIVNGIYASCYAVISHNIAHIAMTPMRWFPWLFDSDPELHGARPFVNFMKQVGIYILPDQYKTHKYKSKDQQMVGTYELQFSNWEQQCTAVKQDYGFAVHATCEK